jgi:hypothetical protein
MGLQVIAEGIEDLDQADWLLRHGCAMAQGFAFGRPAPLPSPAEVLIDEVTDAPATETVEDTPGELTGEYPELRPAPPVRHETDDLSGLLPYAEDAEDEDDDVASYPAPRRTEPGRTEHGRTEPGRTEPGRTEPAEDLVEAPTGELFDALPEDAPED